MGVNSKFSPKEYRLKIKRKKSKKKYIIIFALVLLALVLVFMWQNNSSDNSDDSGFFNDVPISTYNNNNTKSVPKPEFNNTKIKNAVNNWSNSTRGTYSVYVTDGDGKIIAQVNGKQSYFTASIYKLYVAYIGYQKIDDGTYDADESYLYGWTRGECLKEMIRQSHSPCAEKMWNELGKENLTNKLEQYGLQDTDMTGLVTSSRDAAKILANINKGRYLSEKSQIALLNSMKKQIYRDALPAGFDESTVYDKVGFNGTAEYHDVAIVKLADGRKIIVSVLTSGVGSKNIAELGNVLQSATR